MNAIQLLPLRLLAEVHEGDDLAALLASALADAGVDLLSGDVVVVTSKIVSKAEGRVVAWDGTPEHKEALVLGETRRVLRRRGALLITETRHGFVNANAGVDLSNTAAHTAVLLPLDPDRSARALRAALGHRHGVDVAVVITDTFGRAWRQGVTDVAIGAAGLRPVLDLRGTVDATGRRLEATVVAIADEIAGAANLVLHKAAGTPFAILRGGSPDWRGTGSVRRDLVRDPDEDLFR